MLNGAENSMHSAQFMGLINALRTGDPTVDMIAAFLLPLIVQQLIVHLPSQLKKLIRWMFWPTKTPDVVFQRNIIYKTTSTYSGSNASSEEDTLNMYLLRAIQLYVHQHCQVGRLHNAHLDLTVLDNKKSGRNNRNNNFYDCNGNAVGGGGPSTADMLQACTVLEKPIENTWLNTGEHGGGMVRIMFRDTSSNENKKDESNGGNKDNGSACDTTRTVEVKLESTTSVDCIHAFIKTAMDWYCDQIRSQENKDRFMFDINNSMDSRRNAVPLYIAHKLGDEKTFDTLFNHTCHKLLSVVDHFTQKTGKYAITGYPHKLGLLLHGPPGSGKTSLIKALAHYTGRHIVNINLSNISTNAELRKIFFNKMYQIASGGGQNHFKRLGFNQVIFILEDVDATAKEVVMDRTLLAKLQKEKAEKKEKDNKKEENATMPSSAFGRGYVQSTNSVLPDKLNLSGLLNVLDGVVETPGRMVIMTTNRPEILDSALIRPGRIDKILELGYMDHVDDVIKMMEHYYPGRLVTEEERQKVTDCIQKEPKTQVTPAQMEQLAMEEDDLEGFLERLYTFGRSRKEVKGGDIAAKTLPKNVVIRSSSRSLDTNTPPTSEEGSTDCDNDSDSDLK